MYSIRRFFYIASLLIPSSFRLVLHKNHPDAPAFQKAAIDFRKNLQTLGSTYIKFGQMMSARPDIIGQALSNELRNLLDNEPPVAFSLIQNTLTAELKKPWKELFKTIEETPLASASIGQVHKATLHNGKKVAVKVQRPHIQKAIQKDLKVLQYLIPLLQLFFGGHGIKFGYLFKEFKEWITNELNFEVEGRRADTLRKNMEPIEGVTIPTVYWEYTTEKVLTMSFIEGRTLNDMLDEMKKKGVSSLYDLKTPEKLNADILIKRAIAAVAKQALQDRYFHGDLHPGNIIIQKHNHIALVDFGIIGTLNQEEYTELIFTMLALVENDPEALLKAVLTLVAQPLSQEQTASLKEELSGELHKLHEDMDGHISLNHFILVMLSIAQKYDMIWSPGVLLAIKTIGQIDFVAGQIGLREPLVNLMKPEVEKYVTQAVSSTMSKEVLYKGMLDLVEAGKKLPQTISELEGLITSGKLLQVQASVRSNGNASLGHSILSAGAAFLFSIPVISSSFITTSSYRPLLTIGIPLLFFLIIAKIFGKREGVR